MPPRSSKHLKYVPLQLHSVTESMEAKLKRLRPSPPEEESPAPASAASVPDGTPAQSTSAYTNKTPHTANRSDAPVIRNVRRGSAAEAISSFRSEGEPALVDELIRDRNANSSQAPSAALLSTWHRFHHAALDSPTSVTPVLPVTIRSLVVVGALFKRGGYRSFDNYVSAIKGQHIEAGHGWTQLHAHTARWVSRSVTRGIGPARQSCSFDFRRLCLLPRTSEPLVTNGPQQPIVMALLATIFLLREVEVSTSVAAAWRFDHACLEVSWNLPGSKSDHLALGVSRTWPCLCGLDNFFCPYHTAVAHWKWLLASSSFTSPEATPLFPTTSGKHPNKAHVVDTFEAIGASLGQLLHDTSGTRLFGGHTPRVTGARVLSAAGMEINKVRIMARHSGDTILRYVSDAPLESLRADLGLESLPSKPALNFSLNASSSSKSQFTEAVRARVAKLEDALRKLEGVVQTQAHDVVALATGFARTDDRIYVQNTTTATIHLARSGDCGRTICGWPFARAKSRGPEIPSRTISSLRDIPGTMMCEKCLPTERAIAVGRDAADLSADEC